VNDPFKAKGALPILPQIIEFLQGETSVLDPADAEALAVAMVAAIPELQEEEDEEE